MEFIQLFTSIPRELQIIIAIDYVGDWKIKKDKLVYDFSRLYNKIPKVKYSLYENITYDKYFQEYVYTVQKNSRLKLSISKHKKYIFACSERRVYQENEIEETYDVNDEGEVITVPVVDTKGGRAYGLYYLQLVYKDYYTKNKYMENQRNVNGVVYIDNIDKYVIKEKILYVYF